MNKLDTSTSDCQTIRLPNAGFATNLQTEAIRSGSAMFVREETLAQQDEGYCSIVTGNDI